MRLVAYLRVSTDGQAEHGLGLHVQEKQIRRWTNAHGHRIVLWARDEGVSGSNGVDTREALPDALAAIRDREAEGLIAYNLDRLARKLEVQEGILATVWQHGGTVFTVEDDGEVPQDDPDQPMRTAMRQIRGVIAQLERSMIVKRMRDGKAMKKERGGYSGGAPPLGFRAVGRELVPDADEQRTVERIRELRSAGLTYRAIAQALDSEGYPTKRGGRWHPFTVQGIIKKPG